MFRISGFYLAGALVVGLALTACDGPSNFAPLPGSSFEAVATRLPSVTQPQGIDNTDNRPAPVLVLKDVAGKTVSLIDFTGRPLLVNFWASWCAPCRSEMPHLVAAYEKHKAGGFVLLGINATLQDDQGAIEPFMKEFGMTFPVLLDPDGSAQRAFRLRGLPSSYFIDRQGIIRSTYIGTMTPEIIEERIGAIVGSWAWEEGAMTQATGVTPQGSTGLTRRQFLAIGWTVAGLVAAGEAGAATLAFMYPRLEAGSFGGKVIIGARQAVLKNLPDAKAKPDATFVNMGRFYLSRTPDGILALYRKCVHLGCVVPWNEQEDQFHCPCHGSLYNRNGEVLGGPAPRPLDIFPISEEGGSLVVDTGKIIQRKTYEVSQVLTV